jgi:hypothetical protein
MADQNPRTGPLGQQAVRFRGFRYRHPKEALFANELLVADCWN